jgi:hypothetical protein
MLFSTSLSDSVAEVKSFMFITRRFFRILFFFGLVVLGGFINETRDFFLIRRVWRCRFASPGIFGLVFGSRRG